MKVEGKTLRNMSKRRLKGNINNGGKVKEGNRLRKVKQGKKGREIWVNKEGNRHMERHRSMGEWEESEQGTKIRMINGGMEGITWLWRPLVF